MRATGATQMNEHSSRSHSIFTVFNHERQSKLNLVDLAGSERNKKTHNVGQRFRESCAINGGLLALGNVIRALSRNHFNCPENPQHIPYRSSKLTRLLQDSLGGNSTTLLIACISSDADNTSETMRTLQYSALASRILNEPLFHFDEVNAAGSAGEEGGVGRRTSTTNEAARGCSKMPESVSDSAEVAALRQRVAGLEEQLKRCREELKNDEAAFAQQIEYTKSLICENETLRKRLAAFERQAHSPAATPPSTAPAVRAQSMLGASAQKEMRHTVRHHWECMQQGGTNAVAPNVQDTKSGSPIKPFNGVRGDIRRVSPLNNTSDATKYVWRGENLPTNAHTPHRSASIPGPSNINTWNQADKNAELPENISNINFVNDGESTYYELEKHAPEKEGRLAMLAKEALYYQNSNSELRRRLRAVLKMHEAQQHETTMLRREVEQIRELIDGGCQL
uniref:Kinesin-like protein n=1 Tax=Trypanosoma congolense (strain IL3000) TaxID=1068625 RepID=G0UQI7_TRYCI|nr:unnamed protein product [Trypanosoma congolense IL3000]